MALPTLRLFMVMKYSSIMSPIRYIMPLDMRRDIANVVTAGMNTIVMPDTTPGMDSGMTTRSTTFTLLAPRSCAASITLRSSFLSTVYIGSIMKGRKLYTMPTSTAPSVPIICCLGRPTSSSSELITPLFSNSVIMA